MVQTILVLIALIFLLIGTLRYFHFWKEFKKLKVGEIIQSEFVDTSVKSIKIGLIFFCLGSVLTLIALIY